MTTVIEHERHRVAPGVEHWGGPPSRTPTTVMHRTRCGRPFLATSGPDHNTRHHEPATSRCSKCYPA